MKRRDGSSVEFARSYGTYAWVVLSLKHQLAPKFLVQPFEGIACMGAVPACR